MILILFTTSYPYDFASEQTFLQREIPYLEGKFDKVVIVPRVCRGNKLDVPHGVEVDESFADYIKIKSNIFRFVINVLNSKTVCQELGSQPSLLLFPAKLLRLILFSGRAEITKNWLRNWLAARHFDDSSVILYSYWFDDIAMGLGLIKKTNPQIKLVSRAHGYDIYEELYFPFYWPLRKLALANLDKLFSVSYSGSDYFRNRYPEFSHLYETNRLGVENPGFISKPSVSGTLRVVSCAYISPLKRIDLLLEGIVFAARLRPDQKFEWSHFGDGGNWTKIKERSLKELSPNLTIHLPGFVSQEELLNFYQTHEIDVFVNVSSTEGIPVSIMEAISCGIPVIATAVGGNVEIVSERNGFLLDQNPKPREIAEALFVILDHPELMLKKRQGSWAVWDEKYNASRNFKMFVEHVSEIRRS